MNDQNLPVPKTSPWVTRPEAEPSDRLARVDSETAITLGFVAQVLSRWGKLALLAGVLLAAGAAGIVMLLFVPVYRAAGWLKVDARPSYLAFTEPNQFADLFMQTQIEIMRSPMVTEAVVARPDVARLGPIRERAAPAEWLSKKLVVQQMGQSELLQVSLESEDPRAAAAIVNAVLESYSALNSEENQRRVKHSLNLLEHDMARRAEELESLRGQVKQLVEKNPGLAHKLEGRVPRESPQQQLQQWLVTAEIDREVLEAQLARQREQLASGSYAIPPELVEKALNDNAQVKQLLTLLQAKETALAKVRSLAKSGSEARSARQIQAEIAVYHTRLDELRQQLRSEVTAELREVARKQMQEAIARTESELRGKRALEAKLKSQLDELARGQQQTGSGPLELELAQLELQRAESIYQRISDRAEALRTEIAAPARVSTMRPATVPTRPLQDLPYTKLIGGCGVGLLLPFLLAVFYERKIRRVNEAQQLVQETRLEVLGETTRLPAKRRHSRQRQDPRQQRIFDESIDAIRTRLLLSREHEQVQVLVISSAVSGEGKTRLATHLAASLARAGSESTLLIDADLRSPDIHRQFELPSSPGLAEVLHGDCAASDVIVAQRIANLHVLPAGHATANPCRLLSKHHWHPVLQELRQTYRYILIDAPPVLSASEALMVAKAADAVLLCALRDRSRSAQVKLAHERLRAAGARTIGVVVNGVPIRRYEKLYGVYSHTHAESGEGEFH